MAHGFKVSLRCGGQAKMLPSPEKHHSSEPGNGVTASSTLQPWRQVIALYFQSPQKISKNIGVNPRKIQPQWDLHTTATRFLVQMLRESQTRLDLYLGLIAALT
ncbi:hypothetical protein HYQ45_008659 [Verticillium longisporum]|uniref:Uncharacterized protein n=1 Tax=Verticillium longisporum TaxID=100787 RepID=A0A8I2ZLV4_VERLO|nr:hypothetical protein HYQ45_008659 [Verticillium longisporum]